MNLFTIHGRERALLSAAAVMIAAWAAPAQQQYWTGDGGKGIRLAVFEPDGKGLSADDQWMLSLVQGSITGDFNKFSAMTVIDRQNLEKVFAAWKESMSGNYSDADRVKIGNLTNASHILTGSISKTASAFMLELTVTDVASGVRKASYPPTPVSMLALENLSAIKTASAELLRQLGVNLTSAAQSELTRTANTARLQAETMLARGIAAQRRGTEVAALSYFYQAAALDSSLFEASTRSSVMAANISSGNIGADLRNDIVWRKSWVARLEETEATFYSIINSADPPYTLFYSTGIRQGNVNYQNETADLSIPINLSANIAWFNSMTRALQAVQAILNGLNSTNRRNEWGLARWPREGVSNTNPFASPKEYDITAAFELVNQQGRVIGSQTIRLYPTFRIARNNNSGIIIEFTENTPGTVTFNGVRANDISDNLTVRIASINGEPPRNARFAISAISAEKRKQNIFLHIENGVVLGFDGSLSPAQREPHRNLVIPKEAWDKPVTAIGDRAFANQQLTGVTIPDGVTSIGNGAFADNRLAEAIIPSSVTSIGNDAFANNQLTSIIIPTNVTSIGNQAFANNQLTQVTVPNGVTSIGNKAFANNQLISVTIPDGINFVERQIFSGNKLAMRISTMFDKEAASKAWWATADKERAFSELHTRDNRAQANFHDRSVIIDTRNDKIYHAVKIGNNTWMTENLNYKTGNSSCYGNNIYDESYCNKYGRLYDWKTASVACPAGWHLPTREEWDDLVDAAGGKKLAGKKLKARRGWTMSSANGTNEYGFAALPGGSYSPVGGDFCCVGGEGYWWTATREDGNNGWVYRRNMGSLLTSRVGESTAHDAEKFSVRCVQNDAVQTADAAPKPVKRKRKREKRQSFGAGGYFASDFGGGVTWSESGRRLTMPYYGGGIHWFYDFIYLEPSVGLSWGGGTWENADTNPDSLPNMLRSCVNLGALAKFPVIYIGRYVRLFPLYGIDYEASRPDTAGTVPFTYPIPTLEYPNGNKYPFNGEDERPSASALSALWYKYGGGIDVGVDGFFLRLEVLYGIRSMTNNFENIYIEKEKSEGRADASAIPGRGLTVRMSFGIGLEVFD